MLRTTTSVLFRWFSGGWKINAELQRTTAFAAASQSVRHEDVAEQILCGTDIERYLDGIRRFADAGFTHFALVQIGGDHQGRSSSGPRTNSFLARKV